MFKPFIKTGILGFLLTLSLGQFCLAQTTTNLSGTSLTTLQPISSTTTILDPTATTLLDPSLLTTPPATSTGTTTTDPAGTVSTANTPTTSGSTTGNTGTGTTTNTPVAVDPVLTPGSTIGTVPSANQPPASTTPNTPPPSRTPPTNTGIVPISAPVTTPPPAPTPNEPSCPAAPTTPITDQPKSPECPAPPAPLPAEIIVPQFPYALVVTPLTSILIFWLVLSMMNRSQARSEKRLNQTLLKSSHRDNVNSSRNKTYQQLLDFLTMEISSSTPFDQTSFQHLSSKIELLGSDDIKAINLKIGEAFRKGDKVGAKNTLRELTSQIRKEI